MIGLAPGLMFTGNPVLANPQGGVVVHGDVTIGASLGGNLQITQNSHSAIINWDSFSIDQGELTQFFQPNRNSAVLNRVTGGNPSAIHGALKANGNVFVINPNGILVGSGGTIDVHGLVLSTLDVSNGEFLAGGDLNFKGVGADVTNLGRINGVGGDVFLIGRTISNSGTIRAGGGTAGLAAGEEVLLTGAGSTGERLFVRATGAGVSGTGIFNDGTIEGAAVELKAHGNMFALAINNKGSVRATGTVNSGGKVYLRSAGGAVNNSGSIRAVTPGTGSAGRVLIEAAYAKVDGMMEAERGNIRVTGTDKVELGGGIDVSSAVGTGGEVVVEGSEISLGGTASVDASGATGGGYVRIGGGFQGRDAEVMNADRVVIDDGALLRADAIESGRGGNVIVWSDGDTAFSGDLSARGISQGGFAEISGKNTLEVTGQVDLSASNGQAGTLLLDPTNITISAAGASALGGSTISNVWLSQQLDLGTNIVISTNFGAGADAGNITVNDRVEWYQENSSTVAGNLSLLAMGSINFNRSVRSAGTGAINVVAGWDGSTGLTMDGFDMAAVLATMPGGLSASAADAAGLNGGSIFVNTATGAQHVEVGSRFGSTLLAGHDLFLTGSTSGGDRWAQVGFHDSGYEWELGRAYNGTRNEWWGNSAGNVRGKSYIADLGGTVFASGAFQGAGYGATGAIEIGLSGRLDMRAGHNQTRSYVQIGHGGVVDGESVRASTAPAPSVNTTRDGFIVDPDNDNNRPYFSATWRTNYLGHAARINAHVSVNAAEDILVSAARGFETTAGYTDLVIADQGSGAFALIGHGGYRQAGSFHGDVTVVAGGATTAADGRGPEGAGIQLYATNGSGSFAQIGHGTGGGFNRRSIWDQQKSGEVTVTATIGAVRMIGFNQLPRAGTTLADRNVGAVLDGVTSLANNSAADAETLYSHVQIGHGGSGESAPTTGGGFTAPVAVTTLYDAFNNTFANTGALINNRTPEMSLSGNVNVFAGGTVRVRDNMGYDELGNWLADQGPGIDPYSPANAILRDIGIEVRAGNNHNAYAMIGHGGTNIAALDALSTGHRGDISVVADKGGIMFVGGEEKRSQRSWGYGFNFAQIGHGGANVQGPKQGRIDVIAGQGAGAVGGDIIFRTGRMRQSYAQIGHGGQEFTRVVTGDGLSDIVVRAAGNMEMTTRLSGPSDVTLSRDYVDWAMGETGSTTAGDSELLERVTGTLAAGTQIPQSAVQSHNWDTNIKFSMIGHGGSSVNLNGILSLNNTIDVEAQGGSVRLTAGGGDRDFTQIGHGGYRTGGANASITGGDITVTAADDIIIDASNPGMNMVERSSMIGIVTRDADGNYLHSGQNQILGRGFGSYGMIGNGGYDMDGDHSGAITLTAGRHIHAIASSTLPGIQVSSYTAGYVEGPSAFPASGIQNRWAGTRHTYDTLVEASMMQRSFQLYHGNAGASEPAHRGNIVAGTLLIDLGSTGGADLRDASNGDGTGTLYRSASAISGNYASGSHGVAHGTIDYATGKVTIDSSLVTANNGDLENDRNTLNRNINYSYANPTTLTNVAIASERTAESDTALRPNEAFLGHGRILPGTLVLNIGGTLYREAPALNGTIVNASNTVVATIDYDTGRVRFRQNVNPTAAAVSADYQWAVGNSDSAFVQIGNGGQGSSVGGRDTIGNTGEMNITAGGDVRLHAGGASNAYAQLGHGGTSAQSAHSGNINLVAGGIVEFIAGNANNYTKTNQYAQLGHGGFDADGSHTGNISVQAGTGERSLIPGVIGGGSLGGVVFTAGNGTDTYAMIGHGGRSSQAGVVTQTGLLPGQAGVLSGDITINSLGAMTFTAGSKIVHPLDNGFLQDNDDGRNFVQVGHGGWDGDVNGNTYVVGLGHRGAISLTAQIGDIELKAGDTANGSFGDGYGRYHSATIGHGGYATNGDHFGNISVIAENGSVKLTGGMLTHDRSSEKYNWSQIGHGGAEATSHLGRLGDTIIVRASNDILLAAGGGNRNQAMIGNGGLNVDGSHLGDISVSAGGDIDLRGGIALKRVVRRIGEFQEMNGVNGGDANDIGEFNGYYGSGGLGYVMLDAAAAAGGGAKAKLMGDDIQPGTVQIRLAVAAPTLFNASATPDFIDDGAGNIITNDLAQAVVGTIDYATGAITFSQSIVANNNLAQPDVFVNYEHRSGIRNDALYANATIGHGGYATNSRAGAHPEDATPDFVNRGISGNIDVRAGVDASGAFNGSGGSITAIGGNDQRTYVQIGHGGMDATAPAGHSLSGSITTKADGAIVFQGGGGLIDNHHIAFNYYGAGNTEVAAVTAASNADRLRYSTPLGDGTRSNSGITDILYAFAHIGHGGVSAHANNALDNNANNPLAAATAATGHNGNIFVQANQGNIDFTGGGVRGYGHFAMIGHGGYSVMGNHFGDIEVISGADINFTGGGDTYRANSTEGRNFVQIGHGGRTSTGNLFGDIAVTAAGAVNVRGGDVRSDRSAVAYGAHVFVLNQGGNQDENHYNRTEGRLNRAQIGHGGDNVYGDKTGAIEVTAGSGVDFRGGDRLAGSLDNNAGYLNYAMIGHGGYAAWRHIRTNLPLPGNTGQADDWGVPFWHNGTTYVFDGTGQFPWSVDNTGSATLGLGNPLYDGFGGNVSVTATTGNISFQSGTSLGTFGQIGHGGIETAGDHHGDISVRALQGDVLFSANRVEETGSTSTASSAYVQVGHGGSYSSGEQSGGIDLEASGEIRFKAGRTDSYAMVGHGGRESHGTDTINWGGTNPTYRRTTNRFYSQSSLYRPGSRTGDISVTAGGDIAFVGGNANGDRAFTQIGHGGFNIHANPDAGGQFGDGHSGAISVITTGGSLLLRGGDRANSHAMIGHGGTESFGNHGGDGTDNRADSDILVEAATGIRVLATGRFDSNNVARNFAQIGHGGWRSSFRDAHDIDANLYAKLQAYGANYINPNTGVVNTDDAGMHPLTPFTTNTDGLGMGPRASIGVFKGDITVRTTGVGADIQFLAPDAAEGTLGVRGEDSYVQLGHGGWRNFADIEGNITVDSGGALEFRALQGTALAPNVNTNHNVSYAQLGHGGFESGGTFNGNIDVTTLGSILFRGADSVNGANAGYAQLGHGGYSTWKGTTQYREAIRDSLTGVIPVAVLSVGNSGNINVTSGGDLEFYAGRDAQTFAQLGHGGWTSRDSHSGNITVNVAGGIAFHGGVDYLDTDPARANPGGNEGSHAMLGHGGHDSDGTHSGDITVTAGQFAAGHAEAGQGIVFRAGAWNDNFTQLGHGGFSSRTYGVTGNEQGLSGAITVTASGDITFVGGTANFFNSDENARLYAQLGHGGYDVDVTQDGNHVTGNGIGHNGAISVISTAGRIFFGAGDADRADQASVGTGEGRFHSAQLGHGGYEARGDHYGNITVSAFSDIIFLGGSSEDNDNELVNYAQLGHGGRSALGNQGRVGETISVTAGRDIIFRAGNSQDSPVQLGNGGREARGDHSGDLLVRAGGNIEFAAVQGRHLVSGEEKNFDLTRATELGSQGNDAIYDLEGSNVVPGTLVITIPNGPTLGDDGNGNIVVTGGDPGVLTALGLGVGDIVGTIWYTGGTGTNGRITFTRDVNPNNQASPTAANLVTVSYESLEIQGGYAQLGNGGYDADNPNGTNAGANSLGNTGNITLFAGGDVLFRAGVGAQGYAQLGHGGHVNEGRNSGDIRIGSASERIGGAVILTGGNGDYYDSGNAYAQIGHGGQTARGTHSGEISIYTNSALAAGYEGIGMHLQAGSRNNNYAQVGHGGHSSRSGTTTGVAGMEGNSGDIYINSIGDINLIAGVLNRGGSTAGQSVDDGNLYAQIGHGGYDADVSLDGDLGASGGAGYTNGIGHNGAITVISQQGSVNVLAADHLRSFLPSLAPYVGVYDGLVNNGIARNDMYAGGRHHYAMIGHGGIYAVGNHWGDITVHAGFNDAAVQTGTLADSHVRVWGGRFYADQDDSQQFAQIGHGGRSANGQQGRSDDVTSVMAAGNVEVHAGEGVDSYAQIGNGGTNGRGDHRGDVQIFAGGDVSVMAGQFSRTQTLGNGIYSRYYHVSTSNAGELNQNTDRAGLLQAVTGGVGAGVLNFRAVNGVIPDSVKVEIYNDSGLRIGTIEDDASGVLRVVADFTELVDGVQLTAGMQVGTVNYGASNMTFTTRVNPGAEGGAANVIVSMEHVRTDRAYAQIGHGGYDADDPNNDTALGASGNISVAAKGDINVRGGLSLNNYAQVGHGGYETRGAASGNIVMRAGGSIQFEARGQQDRAYVQIGHGGWDADGNHSGNVLVSAGSGGLGTSLGLGAFNDLGDFDRDGVADEVQFASVVAGQGTVTLTGGTFTDSWVQVGHGGRSSGNTAGNASTMTGDVGVAANGDITLQGGAATRGFTQIGHGGWEDGTLNMTLGGDISVISQTGLLRVLAGAGSEAYSLVGHGSLRNAAGSVPLGTRSGDIYLEAANWEITPVGTTSLARIGHRSQAINNGLTAGNHFTLIGNGADGTSSYLINDAFVNLMGVRDHLAGGGGATFGAFGNLVMDLALTSNSAGSINMVATGDVNVRRSVQNAGSGEVNVAAGWDGITPSLDFLDKVPMRTVDFATILADPNTWGNNGGVASIGDGMQVARVSVGSAGGATTVLGDSVEVRGSNVARSSSALIGFAPLTGVNPSGSINVRSREGDVSVLGGSQSNTYAQIGHRGGGLIAVSSLTGSIDVISGGGLTVRGGSGVQAAAHIGHGGASANVSTFGGVITVDVASDIVLGGGAGSAAYSQIGHGGSISTGSMSGSISVVTGGSIDISAPNLLGQSYSKIGHGDDFRGASAATGGTGNRSGNIEVSAGRDISLSGGMIGHVNNLSGATALDGVTQIGVSRDDPTDPTGGTLTADALSQFHGEDELRFYVPRRGNNKIASGAYLNGVLWAGASTDPAPVQRIDEYTIHMIGETEADPEEHENVFWSGAAPANVASFAFYYDTILMGPAPPVPPAPPEPPVPPGPNYPAYYPDDQTTDDWVRKHGDYYSRFGLPGSLFRFDLQGGGGARYFGDDAYSPSPEGDEEEALRRHLRFLGIDVPE